MNSIGKWGTSWNLMGSVYAFSGSMLTDGGVATSIKSTVSLTAMNLGLAGTVAAADYGGGGMSFDTCVNTTTYTGVQFTLGGTTGGCDLFFQVQTFEEQGKTNHGGCDDSVSGNCYKFPQVKLATTTGPVTVRFADLTGGMPVGAAAIAAEIVGLQWQFQSAAPVADGGQIDCPANLTIDDVMFVP
jgi:hypothetical protein